MGFSKISKVGFTGGKTSDFGLGYRVTITTLDSVRASFNWSIIHKLKLKMGTNMDEIWTTDQYNEWQRNLESLGDSKQSLLFRA
jgi:hypothetical protein